jgi:hypothetical protein
MLHAQEVPAIVDDMDEAIAGLDAITAEVLQQIQTTDQLTAQLRRSSQLAPASQGNATQSLRRSNRSFTVARPDFAAMQAGKDM